MRKDDATLPPRDLENVRKHADLLLRKADAYGRFPTPVADLVAAAELEMARENVLDKVFLGDLYRALPNSLKLAPDRVKQALGKVLGLLDRGGRAIHLDRDVHPKKRVFLALHEVGHDFLPSQRRTYALLEDSEHELDPETHDLFEREANNFASEALFQLDTFTREASDCAFGLRTPLDLSARYGSSFYAAARRYVGSNPRPCALLVYDLPVPPSAAYGPLRLRRAARSPGFHARFGDVAWPRECGPDHFLGRCRPARRFTAPTPCTLQDARGVRVDCLAEAFDSTYSVFYLIYPTSCVAAGVG